VITRDNITSRVFFQYQRIMNNKFISFRLSPKYLELLEKISGDIGTSLTAKQIIVDYLESHSDNPKLDPLQAILDRLNDISNRLEILENKLETKIEKPTDKIESFIIESLKLGKSQRAIGRELHAKGWAISPEAGYHDVRKIKLEEQ